MERFGLDFGTTNSSLAWAHHDGSVSLCDLDALAPNARVLRSLLYYSPEKRDFVVGQRAIDAYLREDMQGTLIQSIKTFLADDSFEQTWINDRYYKLEDLIAVIFQHVRQKIHELSGGEAVLVIGRPATNVHRPEREAVAQDRLRKAAQLAGFFDVDYLYEPIAAGLAYETSLDHAETVLIGDFGGGTSDFTVMRLGTGNSGDRREDILASGGVQVAGDSFDSRIMWHKLRKYFGGGTTYRSMEGETLPFPKALLAELGVWHHVPFLRSPKTREQLARIRWSSSAPRAIDALQILVEGNYAFFLFQAIEKAKAELSDAEHATIRFRREAIGIDELVKRVEFNSFIEADRSRIETCMASVLEQSGVAPGEIDSVFLTGGSAQIPIIRQMFIDRFGEAKLKAQDYLTSVATGLGWAALRKA
ncbi:MAG: Hsp70 family protein [Deltaproteobacteria bacterium]|nr:Hsp70 family protein [Deltaproteobacteria bacterium]